MIIAADHRGFELKEYLKTKYKLEDLTPKFKDGDDYPDVAKKLIKKLGNKKGILVCGSGTGVAIAANRNKGVRAVNAYDTKHAEMARKHENVNVLCLGSDYLTKTNAVKIIEVFLNTKFLGRRYARRLKKL